MKYIVVMLVFVNVFMLANFIKYIVVLALYKNNIKTKSLLKTKKLIERAIAINLKNIVYKTKNKTITTVINKILKKKVKLKSNNFLKLKDIKKVWLIKKNLHFSLYSNDLLYFIKNLKVVISYKGETKIISSKKFNEINLGEKSFLIKTSVYSNKQCNVFIVPLTFTQNKATRKNCENNNFKIIVTAQLNVNEPVLHLTKQKNKTQLNYNNNFLKINLQNKTHKNIKIKSIRKINKLQNCFTNFIEVSRLENSKLSFSCSEFNLIKAAVIKNDKLDSANIKSLFYNTKFLNENKTVPKPKQNQNEKNKELIYRLINEKKFFSYYIRSNNNSINYLVNSFLPSKVFEDYKQYNNGTSLVNYIKSSYNKNLQNYHMNKIINWLLKTQKYTTLYSYLMIDVLGVVFDSNCVCFYNSNVFFDKIAINYLNKNIIKYNNINGFYFVYDNIIYNNIGVLHLNENTQERNKNVYEIV